MAAELVRSGWQQGIMNSAMCLEAMSSMQMKHWREDFDESTKIQDLLGGHQRGRGLWHCRVSIWQRATWHGLMKRACQCEKRVFGSFGVVPKVGLESRSSEEAYEVRRFWHDASGMGPASVQMRAKNLTRCRTPVRAGNSNQAAPDWSALERDYTATNTYLGARQYPGTQVLQARFRAHLGKAVGLLLDHIWAGKTRR